MYDFFIGTIISNTPNSVTICVGNIGYKVFTPNPYVFKENEDVKIYLYNQIREDENSLYGFKTEEERSLFLRLINVKGLGPKGALPMLATGSVDGIIDAIDRENILYLTKFPKIGEKIARQIILDLKGKLVLSKEGSIINEELAEVLSSLGYKQPDIKRVIPNISRDIPIEQQIKEALKLLLR
ncbi:MAG: Holliday junction branch migration protein RuvA [Bacilli bacterium]